MSLGCAHCYAEKQSKRNPSVLGVWGDNGRRVIAAESYWRLPIKWNAAAAKADVRRRVFCASLADVFEDRPELEAPRQRLFDLILQTPHLDWLLLTKRPQNVRMMCLDIGEFKNIWLGVSVEDQQRADERMPLLLRTPAAVRFLSCEPLLGPLDITSIPRTQAEGFMRPLDGRFNRIHWVIVGGESGHGARPCQVEWIRSLVKQCQQADVAVFVKQLGARPIEMRQDPTYACEHEEERVLCLRDRKGGAPAEWPSDLRLRQFPRGNS